MAFITGIALPLGIGSPGRLADYDRAIAIVRSVPGGIFIFLVVSLFLWHAAHRMYHTLHDFGIKPGAAAWLACYGVALAGTLATLAALSALHG